MDNRKKVDDRTEPCGTPLDPTPTRRDSINYHLAWEQSKVPEDWRKAIIVPLYKGKCNRDECNNYRGISLLSVPGKIYGRILNERIMKITDKSVGDEQGGFWKGRGCVDQIFAVKILVDRHVGK